MKNLWLTFGGCKETVIEGFCDVDWASQNHRHSIRFLIPFQHWGDLLELQKARSHIAIKYRGGIRCTDACSQRRDLAEKFCQRNSRRGSKTTHYLMQQLGSHRTGQRQQISCKDEAHRPTISLHP